jgi:hypothetical protein
MLNVYSAYDTDGADYVKGGKPDALLQLFNRTSG